MTPKPSPIETLCQEIVKEAMADPEAGRYFASVVAAAKHTCNVAALVDKEAPGKQHATAKFMGYGSTDETKHDQFFEISMFGRGHALVAINTLTGIVHMVPEKMPKVIDHATGLPVPYEEWGREIWAEIMAWDARSDMLNSVSTSLQDGRDILIEFED